MSLPEQVIAWLAQQETDAYLVGGYVRDRLLGRPIYDLDVAVAHGGLALARHLADRFRGAFYPLDEERGTGRALLSVGESGRLVVDVAEFRGSSLETDLADRDFTVNAMAANVRAPGLVIDWHGGMADLEARTIRAVHDSSIRNDPVRALRGVRQAAQLGFALDAGTEELIRRDGASLAGESAERVRDELARLLALPFSACYVERLDGLGLLTLLLPELEPLRGLAQPPPHRRDVLRHSLEAVGTLESCLEGLSAGATAERAPTVESVPLAALSPTLLSPFAARIQSHLARCMADTRPRLVSLKLALLLHDTGKASTQTVDGGQIRFLGHEEESASLAALALARLRFSGSEVALVQTVIRHHMRPLLLAEQEGVSARAVYRFFRATRDAGVDVLLHAVADEAATGNLSARLDAERSVVALVARMLGDYWERQKERVAPPPLLNGHELMREFGLSPGEQVGALLEAVREAQAMGLVQTRAQALDLVRSRLAEEMG